MTSIQAASEREEVDLWKLLDEATPGPWFDDSGKIGHDDAGIGEMDEWADGSFVVALVNAAPFLLDVVEAAWDHVDGLSPLRGTEQAIADALAALRVHLSAASEGETPE